MEMSAFWQWSEVLRFGRRAAAGALACLLVLPTSLSSVAQTPSAQPSDKTPVDHYYDPLPQDTGAAGLKLMLRRLQTTGRLMQVTAHPEIRQAMIRKLLPQAEAVGDRRRHLFRVTKEQISRKARRLDAKRVKLDVLVLND